MSREDPLYCFVYGAMSNPISRARRDIQTRSAGPAILTDHRISFGQGGAANILMKRGWTVHGVLLECETENDLGMLEEIGAEYELSQVQVNLYDSDSSVLAYTYIMIEQQQAETDELPQERYVRIVGEGLKYHCVDEEYIDYQIMNVHYTPSPKEYLTFQNKKGKLKDIAYSTYLAKSRRNQWFLVGRKVVQMQQLEQSNNTFVDWTKRELVGKPDSTWFMLQLMYDPSLPACRKIEDIQEDHHHWAEHQLVEKFQESHVSGVVVGVVETTSQSRRMAPWRSLSRKAFSMR